MSSNRDRGFKRYRRSFGHPKLYKQLRDVPVERLSDDQFEYVVKSLLYAAMGRYRRSRRGRGRGSWRAVG